MRSTNVCRPLPRKTETRLSLLQNDSSYADMQSRIKIDAARMLGCAPPHRAVDAVSHTENSALLIGCRAAAEPFISSCLTATPGSTHFYLDRCASVTSSYCTIQTSFHVEFASIGASTARLSSAHRHLSIAPITPRSATYHLLGFEQPSHGRHQTLSRW